MRKKRLDKTKVLFLDVDGVLNSETYFQSDYCKKRNRADERLSMFDDRKVKLLSKIQKTTNCIIVMSSTWKSMFFSKKKTAKYLVKPFKKCLRKNKVQIIDKIGNQWDQEKANKYSKIKVIEKDGAFKFIPNDSPLPNKEFYGRGLAISTWLKIHPYVKKFVILDDELGDLDLFGEHFVRTNWWSRFGESNEGLQPEHVEKCIQMLM